MDAINTKVPAAVNPPTPETRKPTRDTARASAPATSEAQSTQVSLSSEALQRLATTAAPAPAPSRAPAAKPVQASDTADSEAVSQVATLSDDDQARSLAALARPPIRPADGNKDGLIASLEQAVFDMQHPSLDKPSAEEQALKAYTQLSGQR